MSLATVDNVDNLNLYEKNLLKAIGKFSKNTLKATCYYNVASLYRNQSKHKLALTYYNKALKHNPEYRSKPYIYRELGGVLFLLQKERFAERYYRTSISMADGNEYKLAYALLGDCILWQGRYREASEYYGKYLDSIKTNAILLSIYQHLYTMCLDFMEMGYENNILNCALSNAILNEDLENEDEILTAIEAYPLNIKAWALLGELKAKDKDYNQACCAFKNAAILSNDKLLWFNWLISAHFAGLHLYGLSIFQSMIPTHGLSILNDLSEFVANQLSISIEDKAKFLEEYYSIGNSIQTSFSPSELNLPPKLEIRNWNEKYS